MKYKVSAKLSTGKWWGFGQIREGKFGPQLSFKNTPELKKLINEGGEWINFALFPDEEKKELSPETQKKLNDLKQSANDDAGIPF